MEMIKELEILLMEFKYPTSTGSEEWWDIKSDLDLFLSNLAGAIYFLEDKGDVNLDRIVTCKKDVEKVRQRVLTHLPIDINEKQEKEILIQKTAVALEIIQLIIDA